VRRLKKIDLWEISLVTFPMLPQARVTALKQVVPTPVHQLRQRWLAAAQACARSLGGTAQERETHR
jgi:phage head maturation protease